MKIFLYKFIIILFGVFLLFEFTIGSKIKYYERNLKSLISKSNIELIKVQIREEMKLAINKDRYLNEEDSKLIGQFLMKIEKEINVDESN
tara:strand:+ start:147 stop:416 length:270 start_codon:yes stop_codon:yes gene_type:complete